MNTNQADIDKAAQKIIAGLQRINRFAAKYRDYLSEEDKAEMEKLTQDVLVKLKK